MHKLTVEQREALEELKESEGVRPLLLEVENVIKLLEKDVLTTNLDGDISDERVLVYRKNIAQGARKVYTSLKAILGEE